MTDEDRAALKDAVKLATSLLQSQIKTKRRIGYPEGERRTRERFDRIRAAADRVLKTG